MIALVPPHRWRLARYTTELGSWIQIVCPECDGLLRLGRYHQIDAYGLVSPGVLCPTSRCRMRGRPAMRLQLAGWDPDQAPTVRAEQDPPPLAAAVSDG